MASGLLLDLLRKASETSPKFPRGTLLPGDEAQFLRVRDVEAFGA